MIQLHKMSASSVLMDWWIIKRISHSIDFDNNISVILKVNKEANCQQIFIPGDAAVGKHYLRNNISLLQQSFNDQGLSYEQLSYKKTQSATTRK